MGTSTSKQSLQHYTPEDVASIVASLGEKFKLYGDAVRENAIDGAYLASLSTDEDFKNTLDKLGVTLRLHRRKLEREFKKAVDDNEDSSSSLLDYSYSGDSEATSLMDESTQSKHSEERRKRRHRKTTSEISVEKVMEVALEAQKTDQRGNSSECTNAILDAALAAQAMENMTLQQDMLELNDRRGPDKATSLPKGTITIVLTDIQGSTNLWEGNPEAMRRALTVHDDIQRQLRAKHFGYEIDTAGDAFFLAFSEAPDALAFALELQTALNAAPWEDEILELPWACDDGQRRGLRARVAIHTGFAKDVKNPVTKRTEYVGEAMDVAQKVEKLAQGGQILTTDDTWNAALHLAEVTLGSPIVKQHGESVASMGDLPRGMHTSAKHLFDISPRALPFFSNTTKKKIPPKEVVEFPREGIALATIVNNETPVQRAKAPVDQELPRTTPPRSYSKKRPTSLGVTPPESSPMRI